MDLLSHIFLFPRTYICNVHVYLFSYYFLKSNACINGTRYLLHCAIVLRTNRDQNKCFKIIFPSTLAPPPPCKKNSEKLTVIVWGDKKLNPRLWSHLFTFYTVKVAPHSRSTPVIKFLFLRQTNSECTHSLLSQHDCTEIVP